MTLRRSHAWTACLLGAAGVVAVWAVLATCGSDGPSDGRAAPDAQPAAGDASAPEPAKSGDERPGLTPSGAVGGRPPRRARAAVGPAPPRAEPTSEPTYELGRGIYIEDFDVEVASPALIATPQSPKAMGRVKVLLLKDGHPFDGGHVCFYPAERYADAKPWDGVSWGGTAPRGAPRYLPFWPGFEPVLGSADGAQQFEEATRGITGADGTLTIDVRANASLVPYVRYRMGGIPLLSQPRVQVGEGGETTLTIEAAPMRELAGRCIDEAGRPLTGMWVQAIAPREERPISRAAETTAAGEFKLEVWGADAAVRVRAIAPTFARPLGIYDAETEIAPIPAETTVAGIVPGAGPFDLRMCAAPVLVVEVTSSDGGPPPDHLEFEGLVFDARASAWGRLGGPQFHRAPGASPGSRKAFVAMPRAEAVRPLLLWSTGWTSTALDAPGAERVAVEIQRGRSVSVRGDGWRESDRLRVVAWLGARGAELPCIWIDQRLGPARQWGAADAPLGAIEFQILRDGAVVGRSRIPEGTDAAPEATIDLR